MRSLNFTKCRNDTSFKSEPESVMQMSFVVPKMALNSIKRAELNSQRKKCLFLSSWND